jgi:hypothetical protein
MGTITFENVLKTTKKPCSSQYSSAPCSSRACTGCRKSRLLRTKVTMGQFSRNARRALAARTYCRERAASVTLRRSSGSTPRRLFITREAVPSETPAFDATSTMVAGFLFPERGTLIMLLHSMVEIS